MSTTKTGNLAEATVTRELANQSYKIIGQNWKTKIAEIDVIAEKDNKLYFVEVKYRKTAAAGDGFDYITRAKLHHMQRAAEAYVLFKGWPGEYILMAASVIGDLNNHPEVVIVEI
jgi:putative endonuclease